MLITLVDKLSVMLICNSPISTRFAVTVVVMASTGLSTNTDTIANLDASGNVLANSHSLTNDLVADTYRIVGWTPS